MRLHLRLVAVALMSALLAACATPKPLARDELVANSKSYLDRQRSANESLPQAWTLDASVKRALSHHVDYRISRMEAAIATGNRKLANLDMLPQLVADAGYQQRDSREIITSVDKSSKDATAYLNWDLIDFSVAFLRSREAGRHELIADENRRRIAQLTIRDVAYAWYQARAYQELAPELVALRAEVNSALQQSDEIVRQRLGNPLQAVEYRSSLLLVLRRIDSVSLQLDQARDELARILHLPSGQEVMIDAAGVEDTGYLPPLPAVDARYWQAAALVNRPEMHQIHYEGQANISDARRRLLDTIPRLFGRYGAYYDSNSFLRNDHWEKSSAGISMNLMKLASVPGLRRNLKMQRELAVMREDAMAAAVLSQVAIAGKAYERYRSSWCFSKSLLELNERKSELLGARSEAASIDNLSYIRAKLDALLLRTETGLQYAEYHKARMTLLQSAGLLDVPESADQSVVDTALRGLVVGGDNTATMAELQRIAGEFALPVLADQAATGATANESGACVR